MKFSNICVLVAAAAISPAVLQNATAQQVPAVAALTSEWPETLIVNGVEVVHVNKDVYMLVGAGANVTVQIGDGGVTLVDAGEAGQSDRIVAAVRRLSRKPMRYLITTAADPDKVGGSFGIIGAAGGVSGVVAGAAGRPANFGIMTIAHENASNQMMSGTPNLKPLPAEAIPVSTFFTARKDFYANGEAVEVIHAPQSRTGGDVLVFFRGSDVVSTGDLFRPDSYPQFDPARGGSLQGVIDALNVVLDITVPERNQMGGTRVVPGHGRVCNEADVLEYRDMLTIIRDRVNAMIKKGMTLQQVKAAHPSLEYDGLYGTRREWTGDMFLEAVYNDLSKKK
jgi:glyoxylase-like metal-dependent hydrolase (beta-lactamase superfamily II)